MMLLLSVLALRGLPAGMYAARYKLDTLVIGGIPGGALAQSHQVENYP